MTFLFTIDFKKQYSISCIGMNGECDLSIGLYCLGQNGSKTCQ
jgi:hypothetical protein